MVRLPALLQLTPVYRVRFSGLECGFPVRLLPTREAYLVQVALIVATHDPVMGFVGTWEVSGCGGWVHLIASVQASVEPSCGY